MALNIGKVEHNADDLTREESKKELLLPQPPIERMGEMEGLRFCIRYFKYPYLDNIKYPWK